MDRSITVWIKDLKHGDAAAAERLWARYFSQITAHARARIGRLSRKMVDEEDVALSVFDSLCRGAARGQFPKLSDRHNLWALLVVLTTRKVCDHLARERAQKRGGGRVAAFSELEERSRSAVEFDAVLSREPTPEVAAILMEACERLMNRLDNDLRKIAVGKMEGHSNQELATQLKCGLRTIERRLELIRRIWTEDCGT
jgi:DNA-directed RNA polymerase specialized sigma24 family protein